MERNKTYFIIEKCGNGDVTQGVKNVSGWCGRNLANVYRWIRVNQIPAKHQSRILLKAKSKKMNLTEKDFF